MLRLVAKLLDSRLLLASALLLFFSFPAAASDVKALRLGVHPDHTRLVVDLSTPTQFRIDEDKGGNVIVIELANAAAGRDLPKAVAGQGLVRSVALEPRGKGLAILVSLAGGSKVGDYNFLASSGSAPPRVFVDFVSNAPAPSVPPASAAAADTKPTGVQIASATATLKTMKDLVA